jgi:hypothetical protein
MGRDFEQSVHSRIFFSSNRHQLWLEEEFSILGEIPVP